MIYRILKMRFLHFLVNEKSLDRVERYFEAHGGKTVFVGRFGPGLRSMTPLFAGVSRMKYYRFLPYNLAAAVVWAVAYSLVGYVFGQYWDELLADREVPRLRRRRPRGARVACLPPETALGQKQAEVTREIRSRNLT